MTPNNYQGIPGEKYWEYQRPIGELGGRLNLPKFQPYVSAEHRVLDFGCGGGFLLENLPGKEKIGIEINPAARQAGISRGLDIRASLEDVGDGWADVVISNHALEHVAAPYEVLNQFLRVLRPGGRLVMYLPIDDWRSQRRPRPDDINGHLYTWTPQLMYNLLSLVGFQVERISVVTLYRSFGILGNFLFQVERISVVTHAWPPGAQIVAKSPVLFKFLGAVWAIVRRRRQLFVLATKP